MLLFGTPKPAIAAASRKGAALVRIAGAVIVGLVAAMLTVFVIEWLGHLLFPMSSDVELHDPEKTAQARAEIPLAARLLVVLAWFAGALAGGFIADRIGRSASLAWVIAALLIVAGIVNILMIPQPVWMQIAAIASPLLGGLAAARLAATRRQFR